MRTVFVGAVEGSQVSLDALIGAHAVPELVVTLPAELAHRHSDFADLTNSAKRAGSAVHYTKSINAPETLNAIRDAAPDICFVVGWSQVCHEGFRSIARIGNIGFHPAPLPHLRGRAVIPWTILCKLASTGSTLFWLDEGVDSGPILAQKMFSVDDEETARSLYQKHMRALTEMLPVVVHQLATGSAPRIPQDHAEATYCAKRTPEDGLIDWHSSAQDILRLIRAVGEPYPGAYTICEGQRLIIDRARIFPRGNQHIGLAGQVQDRTDKGFIVRCGDSSCIEVTQWRWPVTERPRRHVKFDGRL